MRKNGKLTEQEELEIVRLYKETDIQVSHLYKIFKAEYYVIKDILKKYNVQLKGTKNFTQKQKDDIFNMYYNQNLSFDAIGRIVGYTGETMAKFFRREGKEVRFKKAKYEINESYFETIDSHEKAYFLGILFTDAYLEDKRNCIGLMIHKNDIEILEKFKKCISSDMPIKTYIRKKNNRNYEYVYLRITNKKMATDLKKLGMHQCKSLTIKYPPISDEFFFSFLCGAWDGDGSQSLFKWKNRVKFSISLVGASYDFIYNIRENLIKFNLPLNIRQMNPDGKKSKNILYSLYSSNRIYTVSFLERLYRDINEGLYLKRKHNKYLAAKQSLIDNPVNVNFIRHKS